MNAVAEVQLVPVAPRHPLTIYEDMAKAGRPASELEKLVDVAILVDDRNAKKAFNAAFVRCQKEIAAMPPIIKEKPNYNKPKYAALENIQATIEPVYLKHGFALSFYTGDSPVSDYLRICCDVMHEEGHTETRHMDLPIDGKGSKGGDSNMNAVQGHGSTFSYGQRYLLAKIFNVKIVGEDNDGVKLATLLGEAQCLRLKELIEESASNFELFMKYASEMAKRPLNKLDEIPAILYQRLVDKLNTKIAAKNKKEGQL